MRLLTLLAVCILGGAAAAHAEGPDLKYAGPKVLYPSFSGVVYEFEGEEFEDGALDGKRGYLFAIENRSHKPVRMTTVPGQFRKNPSRYRAAAVGSSELGGGA